MNEEDVSLTEITCQDEKLIYQNNRELFYFFDKEKNCYTRAIAYQYEANQVIIKQGWDALEARIHRICEKVIAGKLSPLAYYMERSQMEVPMLAQYAGIRKWRVKKHLLPRGFSKLSREDLEKYTKALDISIEQLTNPEFLNIRTSTVRKETND